MARESSRKKVLLVDDDPRIVAMFVRGIEQRGAWTAICAETIAGAVAAFDAHEPSACVIDMQLPDGSGIELIRELRSRSPHVLLVLVTGYGSMQVGADAARAGADHVLPKPVSIAEIVDRLRPSAALAPSFETPSADRALWEHIHRVLYDCGGNKSLAARKLRLHRSTLQRWLDRPAPRF